MPATALETAFVITELNVGGAEQSLVELVTRMEPRGYRPLVVSLGPPPEGPRTGLVEQLENAEIPLLFLNAKSWYQFPAIARKLKRFLREKKPCIVQSFLYHANLVASFAAPKYSKFIAGIRVAEPSRPRNLLEKYCLRRADRTVCVSEGVRQHAMKHRLSEIHKLVVIGNGVGATKNPPRPETAPDAPFLVFVGRLHSQKGLLEAHAEIETILNQHPEHHLAFVGDGPLRTELENKFDLTLKERVHFVGWQPDARGWIRHADLLLLPSRWEGMPNVVLEAMAESTPVATARFPGIGEILGPATHLQAADLDAFAQIAGRILGEKKTREEIVAGNLRRIGTEFSWESMADRYSELFRRTLAETQGKQ